MPNCTEQVLAAMGVLFVSKNRRLVSAHAAIVIISVNDISRYSSSCVGAVLPAALQSGVA